MILTIETTAEKMNDALRKMQEIGSVTMSQEENSAHGNFSVKGVEGEWAYGLGILKIRITDKPWLASEAMIENEINKFFRPSPSSK